MRTIITKAILLATTMLLLAGCASVSPSPYAAALQSDVPTALPEDGFYLRTFADGGMSVAVGPDFLDDDSWSVKCPVDAMTDRRKCSFDGPTYRGARILVFYGASASPEHICIVGHDFPGRQGQIRVDSNPAITTDKDGCVVASRLLAQLKSGTKVITRSYKWPYDWPVDEEANLAGFSKAMEVVGRLRGGLTTTSG